MIVDCKSNPSPPQSSINNRQSAIGSGTPASFRNQEYEQDEQFRFDGMAVAGVWVDKIVDSGIRQEQSHEKVCPGPLLSHRAPYSPNRQHGGCQEGRTAEVHRGYAAGRPGDAIPKVKKSFQADDGEAPGMGANPVEG